MTTTRTLADIEWDYATGTMGYEDYRAAIRTLWAQKKQPQDKKEQCRLSYDPAPHIAVRTTLTSGGGRGR
ncbi:MAG: hypothetical protein JSR99_00015 [Proteobacteria bacterium]|nr:hypothetical protein [Pseudomonadota bacterium]